MENFYQTYCKVGFDKNGVFNKFEPNVPNTFNFAYDVVDHIAQNEPDRRAIVWCNDLGEEKVFTFADVSRYSNKAANLFRKMGVKKGDYVMLVLKRHYQFWFAILALHKLGAIGIPATNLLTVKDYEYRFEAAGVTHIVASADEDITERIDEACKTYPHIKSKMTARGAKDGWVNFDEELEKQSDSFDRVATTTDDMILLYFTSGTTGYPKMVTHNHAYPVAHIITAKFWHNVQVGGLHLTVSDTGWMKSMWGKLYGQWFCGSAVFVYDMEKFVPAELLKRLEKYKVTTFCAPPTIYRFMVNEDLTKYDLSSIKHATTAGEALNPETFNSFKEATGLSLMEAFGQTETTILTFNPVGSTPKVGSMGKPSPLYNVDLVDGDDNRVAPGEVGEIVFHIPTEYKQLGLFDGYYKDEKLTKSVWHDGLYHTGDTAWKDEDGFFWYVGRTDDIIKSSGYRIGPFEVESVLMEHPSVMECAVTGAPDPVRGMVVKATIVLTSAYKGKGDDALVKELQSFVKKQTAPYKYPRIIEFVEELPKTISGKIKRAEIRKQ